MRVPPLFYISTTDISKQRFNVCSWNCKHTHSMKKFVLDESPGIFAGTKLLSLLYLPITHFINHRKKCYTQNEKQLFTRRGMLVVVNHTKIDKTQHKMHTTPTTPPARKPLKEGKLQASMDNLFVNICNTFHPGKSPNRKSDRI